jgi:hypothetical protein
MLFIVITLPFLPLLLCEFFDLFSQFAELLEVELEFFLHTENALASNSCNSFRLAQSTFIGKYLSGLCKLDHVIVLKAGFETQLRPPRLSIPFRMSALGMTREIRDSLLQCVIEPCHVPSLQSLDNAA